MKYKIGDWIVYTNKKWSSIWKEHSEISLYGKIGKIIGIDNESLPFLIEFKENINGYDGSGKGKDKHCQWCKDKEITLYKDYFKLKKLLQS